MTQTKKVGILLNIDGVLTNIGTYIAKQYVERMPGIDSNAQLLDLQSLRYLKILCDQANAEVVIYSAWASFMATPEDWMALFDPLVADIPVVGVVRAEDYLDEARRGQAAQEHAQKYDGRILLLVDDLDETERTLPHVLMDSRQGFQLEQLQEAAKELGALDLAQVIEKNLLRRQF